MVAAAVAWNSSEGETGAAESHSNMMEVMRQEKSSRTLSAVHTVPTPKAF